MYINGKDIYLISVETLKQKSLINKNVDDSIILPAIKTAEDIYLIEVLGEDLVKKLCEGVSAGNISGDYKTLLDEFVQDYLLFKVLSEIQIPLWAKTRNEGIINVSGTEFAQVSRNDCTYTKEYYDNLALGLVPRMLKFAREKGLIGGCGLGNVYNSHMIL